MESIADWPAADLEQARRLVLEHLPPILVETGGERVWTKLPERYLRWMMAKRLASGMAYREGIDFLEGMEPSEVAALALRYFREDGRVRSLIDGLGDADFKDRERIVRLLRDGGVRAGLRDT